MLHRMTIILGASIDACGWDSSNDENVGNMYASDVSRFSSATKGGIFGAFLVYGAEKRNEVTHGIRGA